MRVVIMGGHSRTGLRLGALLATSGHRVIGTVRHLVQRDDLQAAGAKAVQLDLQQPDPVLLQATLEGADAVVYAAGAGYWSSLTKKVFLDRDAAIAVAAAAERSDVRRYVVISSMGADPDLRGTDPFSSYLRLKGQADSDIQERDLDWTIVRPSGLTDNPATGSVLVGPRLLGGSLSRDDLAQLLHRVLTEPAGIRQQFDVTTGPYPIDSVAL